MNRLVDRYGKTGFALLASLIWAIPMAAWAGSADLSPIDQTAYPKVALVIGLVMLVVWLVLISRLRNVTATQRRHRFDIAQMTSTEKGWTLGAAAFATGLVAWLNAAATVDWTPLVDAVKHGKPGPTTFAVILVAFALVMVAGATFSWRKASAAYRTRGGATQHI